MIGNAGFTKNFNFVDAANGERQISPMAGFLSVDAEPSDRNNVARPGSSFRQRSDDGLKLSAQALHRSTNDVVLTRVRLSLVIRGPTGPKWVDGIGNRSFPRLDNELAKDRLLTAGKGLPWRRSTRV